MCQHYACNKDLNVIIHKTILQYRGLRDISQLSHVCLRFGTTHTVQMVTPKSHTITIVAEGRRIGTIFQNYLG